MSKESTKYLLVLGGFIVLSVIMLFYLRNRDELASNHYKFQALKKCERNIDREACEARVEKEHEGCYQAWIEARDGDVDGYARCMGMADSEFKNR